MQACPICHKTIAIENKNIDTMLMAYNYQYIVYSCKNCDFIVDFSTDGDSSLAIISAAFRKMATDLERIHKGAEISPEIMNKYIAFTHSKEFHACAKVWERNKTSFWEQNKHLMIYTNNE